MESLLYYTSLLGIWYTYSETSFRSPIFHAQQRLGLTRRGHYAAVTSLSEKKFNLGTFARRKRDLLLRPSRFLPRHQEVKGTLLFRSLAAFRIGFVAWLRFSQSEKKAGCVTNMCVAHTLVYV